jgi:hypothetical protein
MSFQDDAGFEAELKRAFKSEDPGEAFTRRVLERVATESNARRVNGAAVRTMPTSADANTRVSSRTNWRMALAFAASLVIAVGGAAWVRHARYVEEGERARAQVLLALRVTSEKLHVVRSTVNEVQEAR